MQEVPEATIAGHEDHGCPTGGLAVRPDVEGRVGGQDQGGHSTLRSRGLHEPGVLAFPAVARREKRRVGDHDPSRSRSLELHERSLLPALLG